MLLGYLFLGENTLLTFNSIPGFLKILALTLLPVSIYLLQNKNQDKNSKASTIWLWSMIQFFVFHATLDFFVKTNINSDLVIQALVFQRFTAAAVTLIAAKFAKAKFPLRRQLYGVSFANAALISISQFASSTALITAPLVIYKPLSKMLTVVTITFIGLFLFGEHKKITSRNKWGYLVTSLGVLLLIVAEIIELS